jgi:thiamine-phosphate pyrophosphorylase
MSAPMASRPKQTEPRPQPRLMLITPAVSDAMAFTPTLAAALDATDVAAVVLRLAEADERTLINRVKQIAPVCQEHNAALLVDGRAEIVARGGADGAHLTGIDAFSESLQTLKPERIAGCGGLAMRHDAMLAAEQGADYVMFGEPDAHGERPSFAHVEERVAWWAEVFEAPCVGYAAALEEVAALVAAGADFVALGEWAWQPDTIRTAAQQLRLPESAA